MAEIIEPRDSSLSKSASKKFYLAVSAVTFFICWHLPLQTYNERVIVFIAAVLFIPLLIMLLRFSLWLRSRLGKSGTPSGFTRILTILICMIGAAILGCATAMMLLRVW